MYHMDAMYFRDIMYHGTGYSISREHNVLWHKDTIYHGMGYNVSQHGDTMYNGTGDTIYHGTGIQYITARGYNISRHEIQCIVTRDTMYRGMVYNVSWHGIQCIAARNTMYRGTGYNVSRHGIQCITEIHRIGNSQKKSKIDCFKILK